jgi:hypothetical protein
MSAGMMRDDAWNQQSQDERREDPAPLRNTNYETIAGSGGYELRITQNSRLPDGISFEEGAVLTNVGDCLWRTPDG